MHLEGGRTFVLPKLRAMGVARVDAIVLSHPDLDHAGGLDAVTKAYPNARRSSPTWASRGSPSCPRCCARPTRSGDADRVAAALRPPAGGAARGRPRLARRWCPARTTTRDRCSPTCPTPTSAATRRRRSRRRYERLGRPGGRARRGPPREPHLGRPLVPRDLRDLEVDRGERRDATTCTATRTRRRWRATPRPGRGSCGRTKTGTWRSPFADGRWERAAVIRFGGWRVTPLLDSVRLSRVDG